MVDCRQPYEEMHPHLFSPLVVGRTTLKNRVIAAPTGMSNVTSSDGFLNEVGIIYYGNKARGGAAVVTTGSGLADRLNSVGHDTYIDLTDEKTLRTLNLFTDYVHVYGAKASMELMHAGPWASPRLSGGIGPMGPSARAGVNGLVVKEMTEDDMERVADSWASAAVMAKRGDFDIILLHFGHGWLMSAFLSPLMNQRKDRYGGSLENRARFPRLVAERVRAAVGDDMLLDCRLSGSELTPGGLEIEETIEITKMLENVIDMVQISCGTRLNDATQAMMHPTHFVAAGHNVHRAEAVKKSGVKIPVVAIGAITDPVMAEHIVAEGKADAVALARGFIADPDWAEKARAGRVGDIRPCIKCLRCLDINAGRVAVLKGVSQDLQGSRRHNECSVNPTHGRDHLMHYFLPANRRKKVVVVGGGPSGMQAALKSAERGHEVVLFEKNGKLGGQLAYADHVWFKQEMKEFKEYLIRQVNQTNMIVRLKTTATPELVYLERPDAVIVALGAAPLIPRIPGVSGVNEGFVMPATEVYGNEAHVGTRVAIIGGGTVGCETALHLAHLGREVVLVEMGPDLAPDEPFTERTDTLAHMDHESRLSSYTGMRCSEINDNGIGVVGEDGSERFIEADTVVLAVGMKARAAERDAFRGVAYDVIPVGDCLKAGTLRNAIVTGFDAALRL